ncbi:hypothetical protein OSB04_024002 [Centaurea solstitialis]|uniref:Integrase catalytic domain-containing protein n=1 Tax=Centaurea solstitialis TaxID=347529 RepID=A0AA38W9Y5_9ASTR|nr:hypothetical protein OSB04_024002 [Centaurea solstitialis]
MKKDIAYFVERCVTCLQVKIEHQRSYGKLQQLPIPEWTWEHVTMDFVTKLPRTPKRYDTIWVIVDRLSKSAHFLPMKETYSMMGTRVNLSTAYHPQTDGQSERTIQTLEDMLRACVLDFVGSWEDHLPLIEFAYNDSYHSSIEAAPYEILYGRKCRTLLCWNEVGEKQLVGPEVVQITSDKINQVQDRLKTARDRQKSYANKRRRDIEFQVGDQVMLKVSHWKGVILFGKKGKLSPRYIGPYQITERIGAVAHKLDLPVELGGVHNTFHVSNLRKCLADPETAIPLQDIEVDQKLNFVEEPVAVTDRKIHKLRNKVVNLGKIQWTQGSRGYVGSGRAAIIIIFTLLSSSGHLRALSMDIGNLGTVSSLGEFTMWSDPPFGGTSGHRPLEVIDCLCALWEVPWKDRVVRGKEKKRRKFAPERNKVINDEVDNLLKTGKIREIKYPDWLANVVIVQKKNGKWGVCIDFTDLNKSCPKDPFPLPHIDAMVDATVGHELLTLMDAYSGYNQILMHSHDQEKTAFMTDKGIMPFGLKNAGSTYQRLVNMMFREHLGRTMEVYIDDMLVKSEGSMDHVDHLKQSFDILGQYKMKLNPTKCSFGVRAGKFLGYLVTQRGIEASPEQVKGITELQSPRNVKEV